MIPQEVIDRILHTADIVDVLSNYVTLHRTGANYKCVCPFHDEDTPSMVVSPSKNIWKCFGCQKGGNVVNFIQEHEGISFPEAIKLLGDRYQITVPQKEMNEKEKEALKHRESLFIALEFAQEQFRAQIKDNEASAYLADRKIPEEILQRYGAGFARRDPALSSLYKEGTKKGYSKEILMAAGLINEKEPGKIFDRFIRRITFPFYSLSGKIIGFTGRSIEKESQIKYLNSPDTELFSKGNNLFGLYQARQHIASQNKCYLVEGQFDVLSMAGAGLLNTVCGSGTAFTPAQAKMLRKFTDNVTVIYDGDAAGMKASIRNIDILLSSGINVWAALLPAGEDPDSFALKMGSNKLKKWLNKNEKDFITFVCKIHEQELNDPIEKTRITELLAKSIACIPNQLQRQNFINNLSTRFNADPDLLRNLVRKEISAKVARKPKDDNPGQDQEPGVAIIGLDDAREFIGHGKKELTITFDQDIYAEDWGAAPTVFIAGAPDHNDIQELRSVAYVIRCRDTFSINEDLDEPEGLHILKRLVQFGFTVIMSVIRPGFEEIEGTRKAVVKEDRYGFIEYYMQLYSRFKNETEYIQQISVERCAELISYAPATTRTLKMKDYAATLTYITKTALEDVVKQFIDVRQSDMKFRNDVEDDDSGYMMQSYSSVPSYVDEDEELSKMYRQFGFFPLLDKDKRRVAYMFHRKRAFERVGNFFIEPLLHIQSKNSDENKRIVELTQRRIPYPLYMEWISRDMITYQSFRQRLWEEGDINFSNGNQEALNSIVESWEGKFRKCTELRMYGYYDEGFFAFSNAIFHEVAGKYKVDHIDELGIVTHNDLNYYIPAFSKIYANERRDSDKYYLDRFMMYRPQKQKTTFKEWASLMNEVYKYNHNGKWAILYAFMCMFRSDIFAVDRIFTALFFIGPTGSGKSEIAYSIRSLFMPREAPVFDLNSGTAAALFTLMEKYRNIPLILEEYNDQQIDDVKFQALKSAVYAGEGKQKRKDASSKEIDSSEVNAPLLIGGQEAPQRDDNSLSNRCIICDIPKNDNRTEHEDIIFKQLKDMEKEGLHDILLELLKLRGIFREKYTRVQREVYRELKNIVQVSTTNTDGLSRILNTSSMFLAMCRIIETDTTLELPFTYKEFFDIATEKVLKQVESISTSNRLHGFFSSINYLVDKGAVKEGRDFKIEQPGSITLQKQGRETYEKVLEPADMRIIHLNIENIYQEYFKTVPFKEALSKQSLMTYLQSHEAYVGRCRSTRYKWKDVVEVPRVAPFKTADGELVDPDNSMKRIMQDKQSITSSVVLNYDILQELLNVDYQRDAPTSEALASIEENQFEF